MCVLTPPLPSPSFPLPPRAAPSLAPYDDAWGLGTVLRLLPPTLPIPSIPLPGPLPFEPAPDPAALSSPPLVASSPLVAPPPLALSSNWEGDGLRNVFLTEGLRAADLLDEGESAAAEAEGS